MELIRQAIEKQPIHYLLGGSATDGGLEQNKEELFEFCKFIKENEVNSYLEIGIAKGHLLRFMRDEMQLKITTGLTINKEITHEGLDVIYANSQLADEETINRYDLIFIDGDHSYEAVKKDFNNFKNKGKYIAFHDICGFRNCEGAKQFWDEIKGNYQYVEFIAENKEQASGIGILIVEKGISICFPHLFNEENNKTLLYNLKLIQENTTNKYEVLTLATTKRHDLIYKGFNELIEMARYEYILISNTDILLAPGWDKPLYKKPEGYNWITMNVVECGAIGVASSMVCRDFGRTVETFDKVGFESFINEYNQSQPEYREGFIWYCPSIFKKSDFIKAGRFREDREFPFCVDGLFHDKVTELGWKFLVMNHSWAYHLQRGNINRGISQERV